VSAYDCAMLDLDGVVYVGPHAVEGVPEILAEARRRGMTLAFVTNNASRTPDAVADHLVELGIQAAPTDVVTSAQAAARDVAHRVGRGANVLVIGGKGLDVALRELDLVPVTSVDDAPAAVVQGFHPDVGWKQLAEGTYAIRAGALWVASNLDLTVPTARGIAPGNGTLVRAVSAATGTEPDVVAGKPYRPLFDETVRRISSSRPLVVGDRLDTDIEGAVTCGADSLLVMTGVTDLAALCHAPVHQRPTYVAWTMSGLLAAQTAPTREGRSWRLDDWEIAVEDGTVQVLREGEHRDGGLAVLAAAAWTWLDAHTSADGVDGPRIDLDGLEQRWGSE
jgi:glycerol 3-phosphatase-2